MTNKNNELIFWNLKLGQKGFDEKADPYIWSYILEIGDEGVLINRGKSYRKNRNYSKEIKDFFERLKGI